MLSLLMDFLPFSSDIESYFISYLLFYYFFKSKFLLMDEFLDPNLNAAAVKYCSNYFVIFFSSFELLFFLHIVLYR